MDTAFGRGVPSRYSVVLLSPISPLLDDGSTGFDAEVIR